MRSSSRRASDADRPNVLFVVADTARADDASDPTIMPTLQDLRSVGTDFAAAFASAPWTLPSHAGIFTGAYSSKHGAHGGHPYLDGTNRTIAEAFQANGYETFAASNNTWISAEFGFDRGFQNFWKGWQLIQSDDDVGAIVHELGPFRRAQAALSSVVDGNPVVNAINACYNQIYRSKRDYGASRTTSRVETWLATRDNDRPFFAFVNYLEPHIRYQPPDAFARQFLPDDAALAEAREIRQEPRAYDVGDYELSTRELSLLRALYRGELAYVDAQLTKLRFALREEGVWENTILIVAGDHGENIGDHGFLGHQYNIYDTLIHVPLVVTGGPFDTGQRVEDLVQLVDIAPTLLDIPGIEDEVLARQVQGTSFHPDKESTREAAVAEYMTPQPPVETLRSRYGPLPERAQSFDRRIRTIRTHSEKLIRGSDGFLEYYDLDRDPAEGVDRTSESTSRVAILEDQMDGWLAGFDHAEKTDEVAISGRTERRLANLGYM